MQSNGQTQLEGGLQGIATPWSKYGQWLAVSKFFVVVVSINNAHHFFFFFLASVMLILL